MNPLLHIMVIVTFVLVHQQKVQCFSPLSASFLPNMLGKEGRSPPFRTEIASNQGSDKELQVAAIPITVQLTGFRVPKEIRNEKKLHW